MLFERQNSSSKFNIFIHMDSDTELNTVSTCRCTTYAVSGISAFVSSTTEPFQENVVCSLARNDVISNYEMVDSSGLNRSMDTQFQSSTFLSGLSDNQQDSDTQEFISHAGSISQEMNMEPVDENIFQAVNEALNTGSLTPLVKEELKCSIQSRRLKEGKNELQVSFSEPRTYELTADEVERVENRRIQNRVAAQRFREKQKYKIEELQRKCNSIESQNTELMHVLRKLRQEKEKLKKDLDEHLKVCPFISQTPR